MSIIDEVAELVRRETGIVLPAARETAILAAVARAAPGLDPAAFVRAAADPRVGPGLVSRLVDEVTIQETAFVREREQLDAIGWHSLLQIALDRGSQAVRVWSVGCASGEEAYTLALLAAEAFAPGMPTVDVLGTDISGAALAAASAGRYRDRAVRGLEPSLRRRYLARQADGSHLVGESLRRLVRFRQHNLTRDPVPPSGETGFDLVTCRNVLIYFDEPTASAVTEALRRSVTPDGMLMLGAADALQRASAAPGIVTARHLSRPLRPRARGGPLTREQWLSAALAAADRGDHQAALSQVASLLAADPLDAEAQFIDGLIALKAGRPAAAAAALRRALFADGSFGLAAFTLGRAYDALGDTGAARRSYQLALGLLDPVDGRHDRLLQQVDLGDIARACQARLAATPLTGDPG
jgi:chemotaxis protein methyltransferase CheR